MTKDWQRIRRILQRGQARAALGYGLLAYLGLQAALTLLLETCFPGIYDPEFEVRLTVLKTRRAEAPDRPLVVLLGSSRSLMAFQPELLPPLPTADGQTLLPFNLAHPGAGPIMQHMQLRRLLRSGIRPDWLLVEVMPAFLAHEGRSFLTANATAADLSLLQRYIPPGKLLAGYLWQRLGSGAWPASLLRRLAPAWTLPNTWADPAAVGPLGGHPVLHVTMSPHERRERAALARSQYARTLQQFRIAPAGDRALRDLLDLCRQEGIGVVLVRSPEGSAFRGWYSPEGAALLEAYLTGLSRQYGVRLVAAQEWLSEADFYDGHHVFRQGAEAFTVRLEREVLRPLAESCQGSGSGTLTADTLRNRPAQTR